MSKKKVLQAIHATNTRAKIFGNYPIPKGMNYVDLLETINVDKEIRLLIKNQIKHFQPQLIEVLLYRGFKTYKFADSIFKNCLKEDVPHIINLFNRAKGFKANDIAKDAINLVNKEQINDLFEELLHCKSFDVNQFAEQGIKKCESASDLYRLMYLMNTDDNFDKNKFYSLAQEKNSTTIRIKKSKSKTEFTHS
jgi:hypothetical protein